MKAEEILWGVVALIILYLAWETIAPLLSAIFFAAILAYAVLPLHKHLTKRTDNKKSALILTILLIGLSSIVTVELLSLIHISEPTRRS